MNLFQMVEAFKANPLMFILQKKMNVPTSMLNDPNAMLQHLLATGQVSQNQVNTAYRQIQNGGGITNYGR